MLWLPNMDIIDFLTCGLCQTEFPLSEITIFMEHKRSDCTVVVSSNRSANNSFTNYECYTCPERFGAAVSLLLHAQFYHKQKIFHDRTNRDGIADGKSTFVNETGQYSSSEITEPLSKCCTSVVPKKRKRHFETKHRISFFKAVRQRKQQQSWASNEIQVNVESSRENMPTADMKPENRTEHPALLSVPSSDRREGYVTISYPDAVQSSNTAVYQNSTLSNGELATAVSTSNSLLQVVNGPRDSTSVLGKKKYPISKPFKCDSCEHSFNQRIHLTKHQSKHTGVKPYKCDHCTYATVERSHLTVHMRTHTGEKPFKCNQCEYSTAQNSGLKTHLKRHHGTTAPLECSHCGKQFPEKAQLFWHKQEHSQPTSASNGSAASHSTCVIELTPSPANNPEAGEPKPF